MEGSSELARRVGMQGVDCGGAHCPPCVRLADQMDAIEALREKLRKEYDEKQRESQMTGIAKAAIVIIALIGAAIVCGGPLIYIFRSVGVSTGCFAKTDL